ncbi:MAG TPA: aldo/keto reductase [Candidatus Binatia bacterium]|nr:aldo/keto reductase [Candidatus Binatia bacterium]
MKIALGTAQFGMSYGVANEFRQVAMKEMRKILDRAAQASVDTIDTAIGYGDSEARLGELGVHDWNVITKLPALPDSVVDVGTWLTQHVSASLRRLRIRALHALLLHRPADLIGRHGGPLQTALRRIKHEGQAKLIGVSIYDPGELDLLWQTFRPDLVQAPLNVLDQRLVISGWLGRLNIAGIRVHTRSSFLQGLLLMPARKRPDYFKKWASALDKWVDWCMGVGCSPLRAAVSFVLAQPGIEKVVVGVDSLTQLNEILQAAASPAPSPSTDLACQDVGLLEPFRWRIL